MEVDGIMRSKISQTEKDKYCMILLICGIYKRKNELIETESRLVVAKAASGGNGVMLVKGYRLLVIR